MEPLKNSFRFFRNTECEYFPCHRGLDPAGFSCLFCYCPLYLMGEACGGNFRYLDSEENPIKDCSGCTVPHRPGSYEGILDRLKEAVRDGLNDQTE